MSALSDADVFIIETLAAYAVMDTLEQGKMIDKELFDNYIERQSEIQKQIINRFIEEKTEKTKAIDNIYKKLKTD